MYFFRVIKTIRNRVKIINRIWIRVIFLQSNCLYLTRNHSRCFFRICFLKTCRFRIYSFHFWTIKSRVRFLLNVFIVTRKIIYTRKNASSSMKILELKKFICKKKRIHLDFYNFDVFHVYMMFYKSKRQCVENAEKLAYSNRVVATVTKIHTVRLKKNADFKLFIDEKKKTMFINHELYINVDVIFAIIQLKFKAF